MYQDNIEEVVNKPIRSKKLAINVNKKGTVRNVNGMTYVDLLYLNQRIRESSGLPWNKENSRIVRGQLDKIIMAIMDGTFVFRKVFPKSKKVDFFTDLERQKLGHQKAPNDVPFNEHATVWYETLKATGRVRERTLLGYKSILSNYLIPYFAEMSLGSLNATAFDGFIVWAKQQQYRGKPASNTTINKCLILLQMICKNAAINYGWGTTFNPFFGYKKLEEVGEAEKIDPFSLEEQILIISSLPDHWRPYFRFAFCSGLRCGEQLSLRVEDVNLEKNQISIRRALTLNEEGKVIEDKAKNRYSRRTINLLPVVREILDAQMAICNDLGSNYLFCTPQGTQVQRDNLRGRVWEPALKKAGVPYRPMMQTRHSFATTALSLGENPLWIAKVMGHSTTRMVIDVYARYIENLNGTVDGGKLNDAYK